MVKKEVSISFSRFYIKQNRWLLISIWKGKKENDHGSAFVCLNSNFQRPRQIKYLKILVKPFLISWKIVVFKVNPFQPIVPFHIETSYLFCSVK